MTYRERRQRRVERLRGWAESRERRAAESFGKAAGIADQIPFGQPILVGHHSEGRHRRDVARIDSGMRAGVESARIAERHAERADNIEAAMDRAIYSDDPDAIEQLRARIANLEGARDRIKAYNATCRRGSPDESLLDERQRATLETVRRVAAYSLGPNGAMPGYALTNLGGNINRQKKRLAALLRAESDHDRLQRETGVDLGR